MEASEPLTQGAHRNQFETSFVKFQGGKGNAFAVGSATDALELQPNFVSSGQATSLLFQHTHTLHLAIHL